MPFICSTKTLCFKHGADFIYSVFAIHKTQHLGEAKEQNTSREWCEAFHEQGSSPQTLLTNFIRLYKVD